MQQLSISVLGSFRASLNHKSVTDFSTNKVRALLVYLALEPVKSHARNVIADFFWPDQTERAARNNLRQALHLLNNAVPSIDKKHPFLKRSRQSIQFNAESEYWVDALAFNTLIQQSQKHTHENIASCISCIHRLEEAVSLYQGHFLDQFMVSGSSAFELWQLSQREWYQQQALNCLYTLTTHFQTANLETAQQYGQRILEIDPLDEQGQQLMLSVLAQRGQRGAALTQYERYRLLLGDTLGISPSDEMETLYNEIRQNRTDRPTIKIATQQPILNKQTVQPSAAVKNFVGRRVELEELADLLLNPSCRLLTVTGPHGVGKSVLTRTVMRQQWTKFKAGCCLLNVDDVTTLDAFYHLLGQALGLGSGADKTAVSHHLNKKQLLLLLDGFNFEFKQADELLFLLRAAPQLKIMLTSYSHLELSGEWVYDVGCLDVADAHGDGVTLFIQCAQQADARFEATAVNRPIIQQICRQLQGNPLLIELAASWLRTVSCKMLLQELEANHYLLSGLGDGETAVYQNLRAKYEEIWHSLSSEKQTDLKNLSVFRGGFSRTFAQEITAPTPLNGQVVSLSTIANLRNCSLLMRCNKDDRYEMPELLRQFVAKKLDEDVDLHNQIWEQHGQTFASFLATQTARLRNHEQFDAIITIQQEFPNIKQAWRWAIHTGNEQFITQSVNAIYRFCDITEQFQTGLNLLQTVRQKMPSQISTLAGNLLTGIGLLTYRLGDVEIATSLLAEGSALLSSKATEPQQILPLAYQAMACHAMGDLDEAHTLIQQSLALSSTYGDAFSASEALLVAGIIAYKQGKMSQAQQILEQSVKIKQVIGDLWGAAHCYMTLGEVALTTGERQIAAQQFRQSLNIWRTFNNQQRSFNMMLKLGNVHRAQEQWDQAVSWYLQGVELANERQDSVMLLSVQSKLASMYRHQEAYDQAIKTYHAALELAVQQQNLQETKTILYEFGMLLTELQQQGRRFVLPELTAVSNPTFSNLLNQFNSILRSPGDKKRQVITLTHHLKTFIAIGAIDELHQANPTLRADN